MKEYYQTFSDFQRDELRPGMRVGWSSDEWEEPERDIDFDVDPFDAQLAQASRFD